MSLKGAWRAIAGDDAEFFKSLRRFLKTVLKLMQIETMTTPGRVNCLGLNLLFALMMLNSVLPIVDAIVRIFVENYSSGFPLLDALMVFAGTTLLCVYILGRLEAQKG